MERFLFYQQMDFVRPYQRRPPLHAYCSVGSIVFIWNWVILAFLATEGDPFWLVTLLMLIESFFIVPQCTLFVDICV
jgi:hypothetical protein